MPLPFIRFFHNPMHWYLIHTNPRLEKCALENLERQGYECYLPIIPTEKLRQRRLTVTDLPLFPRYLFIHLGQDVSDKSWLPIRSTKGVSNLVRFGAHPAKADDSLIATLKSHETALQAEPERLFKPGETVSLSEGAFKDIEAIYLLADGEHRAMVLIELMSRPVTMRVETASLLKHAG
jgi:transcriptional antiterminator RfaH